MASAKPKSPYRCKCYTPFIKVTTSKGSNVYLGKKQNPLFDIVMRSIFPAVNANIPTKKHLMLGSISNIENYISLTILPTGKIDSVTFNGKEVEEYQKVFLDVFNSTYIINQDKEPISLLFPVTQYNRTFLSCKGFIPKIGDGLECEDRPIQNYFPRVSVVIDSSRVIRRDNSLRSKEAIDNLVEKRAYMLNYAFKKYISKDPFLKGEITFDITISKDGLPTVKVIKSSFKSSGIAQSIAQKIEKRMKFPRVKEGNVTIRYAFSFGGQNRFNIP